MQCAESLRVQAYFDGEIDAVGAAEIERHADNCAECRALLSHLERTRSAIRGLPSDSASPALRNRIVRALDKEMALESHQEISSKRLWRLPAFWAGALGGLGASCAAAVLAFFLLYPSPRDQLLDQLVRAHVRSLMPAHLIDVVSTDQHTVKPWFSGHADVSPAVADFSSAGYRLVGGRADYLENQRSAVVVYQHGQHTINIFSWVAGRESVPASATRNGYRLVFWKDGNVAYCAVSDTGWDELFALVRLVQNLSARDAGRANAAPQRE